MQNDLKESFQYIERKAEEVLWQKDFDKGNRLLFLLEGEMEVIYGNLNPRIVHCGHMILLSSLTNCVCRTLSPVRLVSLEFDKWNYACDSYALQSLTPIYSLIKYDFQEVDIRPPLDAFLELLEIYLKENIAIKGFYQEKMKEFFILLRAYYDAEELTMLFYPLLGKNMNFKIMVLDNYTKVKNASEYAELCGFSLGVFQRKFKDVFGETVYQWMQRQKAEQIKHRLMITDINPKELADEFGFASAAHFNKFCKIWFGMTPSELRQTYLLRKNLK